MSEYFQKVAMKRKKTPISQSKGSSVLVYELELKPINVIDSIDDFFIVMYRPNSAKYTLFPTNKCSDITLFRLNERFLLFLCSSQEYENSSHISI